MCDRVKAAEVFRAETLRMTGLLQLMVIYCDITVGGGRDQGYQGVHLIGADWPQIGQNWDF